MIKTSGRTQEDTQTNAKQPVAKGTKAAVPQPNRNRSSSGLMIRESFMLQTNGGGRLENVPGFRAERALAQGFGGGRIPARFRSQRLGSASYLEFAFPQSVCGNDDRVPVVDTTSVPWRCVCQLVIEGLHDGEMLGTGWLAGPRTIITAGHNVYSKKNNSLATRIWVIPGRQGDVAPFGLMSSQRFQVHPTWERDGDPRFDYAAIYMDKTLGNTLGWFGFTALPDSGLHNLVVNNVGYPADKQIGTQWFNAGRITNIQDRIVEYGLDTEEGQSGSPIFALDAQLNRNVVAIHAYGGCPANRGIRINTEVFQTLVSWLI